MKTIKAYTEIITPIDGKVILRRIEEIGRVCYKSEDRITNESAPAFVAMLIKRGHEAMLEHVSFSVKFVVDRGVSHEIVRHRIAAYAQESTRYCNYSQDKFGRELTFIKPCFWDDNPALYKLWELAMEMAEAEYLSLVDDGAKPEEARSVLPNSLKTEIVVTMNLREWRHFFRLRTAKVAHPQMREVTRPLLASLQTLIPIVFDDITWED